MQLRILYWRKQRGLTLEQLHQRTGIPLCMLNFYERGKADPPTDRILRMAEGLEISVSDLFPATKAPSRKEGSHA